MSMRFSSCHNGCSWSRDLSVLRQGASAVMTLDPAQLLELRKAKQALQEIVRETETAVTASQPNLEELDKIQKRFDESIGRVKKMFKPSPPPPPPSPPKPVRSGDLKVN